MDYCETLNIFPLEIWFRIFCILLSSDFKSAYRLALSCRDLYTLFWEDPHLFKKAELISIRIHNAFVDGEQFKYTLAAHPLTSIKTIAIFLSQLISIPLSDFKFDDTSKRPILSIIKTWKFPETKDILIFNEGSIRVISCDEKTITLLLAPPQITLLTQEKWKTKRITSNLWMFVPYK